MPPRCRVRRDPVFLELVTGRQAQAQAPPTHCSPPCIHPSPVGLAWFKSECLAGSASSLPPLFPTPLAQRPPLLVSPHAVEGQWLEWGPWGPCSTSCANGTQQRSRKCSVAGPAWATCTGALTDTRECSNLECPGECSLPGLGAGGSPASRGGDWGHSRPPSSRSHGWQVGAVECMEPVLQDVRHGLAAPLSHVPGLGYAGLPLRGHRRGGEALQREEVSRYWSQAPREAEGQACGPG